VYDVVKVAAAAAASPAVTVLILVMIAIVASAALAEAEEATTHREKLYQQWKKRISIKIRQRKSSSEI